MRSVLDDTRRHLEWEGLDELRPTLRQALGRSCADEHDLEDAIQETLMRAARYRQGLLDPARLEQWVVRIGQNVCRDRRSAERRRRQREAEEALLEELEGGEPASEELVDDGRVVLVRGEPLDAETALVHLERALAELAPRDLAMLGSRYTAGRSCRATAELLGVPEGVVKVRVFRARRKLLRGIERLVSQARLARLAPREPAEVVA